MKHNFGECWACGWVLPTPQWLALHRDEPFMSRSNKCIKYIEEIIPLICKKSLPASGFTSGDA